MRFFSLIFCSAFVMTVVSFSVNGDTTDYMLVIKDHRFEPSELTVPAGKRIKLVIDNQDASAEEFESHDLRIEKIIPANTRATVWVGPLKQGKYSFVGEYHEDTAQGTLISE
jgi:plastocyanin